ncbi:hypothetical protein DICPUDRAFT_150401 [Dictyostelium purpureum]|uniref:Uncharacterized protein n=1 Tax=Dictyostelium purpureum TaxID=5786 RepID=F0ZG87_DICPU|nr:uncharacterized protein DICPUDRAFT_150401 [Dictyostelium purpureum]EGC37062.1 hypothetical protein DICPUDRAFT_150401 [Dictyostelium purpureum]|eukprot:XP_003286419.1 hypothetical protein DICPUDRAFT_150401 [Dictyostelium purpureum]
MITISIVNCSNHDTDSCFNECMKRYKCYIDFSEAECVSVADRCDRFCSK